MTTTTTDLITIAVDGRELPCRRGERLLDVLTHNGIWIPHLCYVDGLTPFAGCRTCVVEIQGVRGTPVACTTAVTPGMTVQTQSPALEEIRRGVLEMILCDHPGRCFDCHRIEHCGPGDLCLRDLVVTERCVTCAKNKHCELQDTAEAVNMRGQQRYYGEKQSWYGPNLVEGSVKRLLRTSLFIEFEFDKCILCTRCVRVCEEIRGRGVYTMTHKGPSAQIDTAYGVPLQETSCEFCGACVDVCPTAAIMDKGAKWVGIPERSVDTICPHCSVGCGLTLQIKKERLRGSAPDINNLTNNGHICIKGRYGLDFVNDKGRLTVPLLRRDGQLQPATWEEATAYLAQRLPKYRGQSFAAIGSPRLTNEESYVLQKFTRTAMASPNIGLLGEEEEMAAAVLGEALGQPATSNAMAEIGEAKAIFIVGANPTQEHPVLALEVIRAARAGAKIIIASPTQIELCEYAALWLRHRPGTELGLLGGMLRVILDDGLANEAYVVERCQGYQALQESLEAFDLRSCARITGLAESQMAEAARLYASNAPASILFTAALARHTFGKETVAALVNLALLTGNVGRRGAGVNLLGSGANRLGASDAGCHPQYLPGYQAVRDAEARARFEGTWGSPLPPGEGLRARELWDAIAAGGVKALYIVGADPAAHPAQGDVIRRALAMLELCVVQELFLTETARYAHVVLPAASFAEKEGTYTNMERRVQRLRRALEPQAQSQPDGAILCGLAKALGASAFDYPGPGAIMEEIAAVNPLYGGISHPRLEYGGIHWPCPGPDHPGTPTLYEEGFPGGKARLLPLAWGEALESPDADYPFLLRAVQPLPEDRFGADGQGAWVELNPQDAASLGLADGARVEVASRRGRVTGAARRDAELAPGVIGIVPQVPSLIAPLLGSSDGLPTLLPRTCAVRLTRLPG